ncbi:hypothetical protein EJB05_23992 [Eragrostis curvula]|uniref:Peptidase S54 rhomboid domain-containing protein n=1 Tax=Eragrostis curvula TaxID=38414 RepID=A0A5J9V9H8_9POAL|nr:hypothetical protein EJB05_23992 [Eragrostis curvula]
MQARHLMAGVVKWKLIHTETAPDSFSLRSNSSKCQSYPPKGHVGNYNCFVCHSLKSILRPKGSRHVIVKVQNKDADESCSSKFGYEDNETISSAYQRREGNQLRALESYFSKLYSGKAQQLGSLPPKKNYKNDPSSINEGEASIANDNANFKNRIDSLQINYKKENTGTKSFRNTSTEDYKDNLIFDEKNFWTCTTMILLLLFETASPVKDSENEYLSLPLIYGAKVNNLILSGEWWRLLTPMWLHSGFLHVALGCWALLTFGPRVCRAYGQVTFFLIYILGGVCGNLTSFVHTPELTVCGTGPVFSLIGAWLIYQSQNKQFIDKDISENMFWQAVIAAALSFLLSIFGGIDNWAHLGATISGLFFGYLTCPSIELDNAAKNGQKEALTLVRRQADPCKSVTIFAISILALGALAFAYGQFSAMDLE